MENTMRKLVAWGIKAPSGHNTQPWRFRLMENGIEIHPDFSRALPVVDGDHHALYASLGCAAENMMIAATREGLGARLDLSRDEKGQVFITIQFKPDSRVEPDVLFDQIERRQSTRNKYRDQQVPPSDLEKLRNSFRFEGISLLTLTEKEAMEQLTPFIIDGSNRQFENRAFVKELISWIRFSRKEALQKKDGIWHASMGLPATGRLLGEIIMGRLVSAKSEAKRWEGLIRASAGLALFVSRENDASHWISLGRAFQRFGLTASSLNISLAHMNMPCEEMEVRQEMARHLKLGDQHPLLLIRFGYSDPMPYSFRRELNEVMVH